MNTDELYAELLLERFGPVPWRERRAKPKPPRRHWRTVLRVAEAPEITAARRAELDVPWREAAA